MTDDTPTTEQAREYAAHWAAQVQQTTGAERAEAERSATYWAQQAEQRPRLRDLMTKGVTITAGVTAGLLVLTLVGGFVLHAQRASAFAAATGPDIEQVASLYLDALIARDATALAAVQRPTFSLPHPDEELVAPIEHIAGNKAAAASIDLKIDYEIVQSFYDDGWAVPQPDRADHAQVVVKISYSLLAGEERVTVWALQVVELQRDFFYGSDTPEPARLDGTPSFRGAWGVTGFGGTIPPLAQGSDVAGSDFAATALEEGESCYTVRGVLSELSNDVLRDGVMPAECFAGGTDFVNMTPEDLEYLLLNMTPLREAAMTDIVGIQEPYADGMSLLPGVPFAEVAITAGERRFLFTLALVDPATSESDDAYKDYRIVSIVGLD